MTIPFPFEACLVFGSLSIMLLVGIVLRAKIKFFQDFLIPSCLIGGVLGLILISTDQRASDFGGLSEYKVGIINARAIARKLGLGHVINTTVLGAYCRFTDLLPMDDLVSAIEEMVPAKKKENVEAAHQGYAELITL